MTRPQRDRPSEVLTEGSRVFVLVEGDDEVRVLRSLRLPGSPHTVVHAANGRDRMEAAARSATLDANFPGLTRCAVLVDVDEDPDRAVALARRLVATLGGPADTAPGEVREVNGRRYGFDLIPGPDQLGALETLIRAACPPAPWTDCADAWEACVARSRSAAERDKAWLRVAAAAWPKVRQGWVTLLGAPEGVSLDHAAFDRMKGFLRALASDDAA